MSDYKVVPVSPTREIIDAISVSVRHRYTGSMIYAGLLHAAPDTGMVAVRRSDLEQLLHAYNFDDSISRRITDALDCAVRAAPEEKKS